MDNALVQEVTAMKPTWVLFRLALPISLGRLINVFGNFIVMMMVARLGEKQIAAGSLALSGYLIILTMTTSILFALGIQIRYQNEQSSPQLIGSLVRNAFVLALAIALPAALSLACMDKLLLLLHQDPELVALSRGYFYFSAVGIVPLLLLTVILQFYLSTNRARVLLYIELISLPLTLLLAYGLVLGHFGLPQMGLAGASLANLVVQLILLGIITGPFLRHNGHYQFFNTPFTLDWQICRDILKLGLPIGLQLGGELAVMSVALWLMGYFGVEALAALQITTQYALFIIMLNFGLSQALALIISEEHKKQTGATLAIMGATLRLFAAYILPVVVIFCFFSNPLTRLYLGAHGGNPSMYFLTQAFFWLSAAFLFMDGLRNLLSAALRGFHDSQASTRINLLCLWGISLPVSALVAFSLQGGPIGLRIGFLSGFIVAVVLLGRNLLTKLKHVNDLKPVKLQGGGYE